MPDVPVRAFEVVFKANPFYVDFGNLRTKGLYDRMAGLRTAVGNFFDDAVHSFPQTVQHVKETAEVVRTRYALKYFCARFRL